METQSALHRELGVAAFVSEELNAERQWRPRSMANANYDPGRVSEELNAERQWRR